MKSLNEILLETKEKLSHDNSILFLKDGDGHHVLLRNMKGRITLEYQKGYIMVVSPEPTFSVVDSDLWHPQSWARAMEFLNPDGENKNPPDAST